MLLDYLLNRFVAVGSLTLIDAKGKTHRFVGNKGTHPNITVRLHNPQIERALFLNPEMALGEGYMNQSLTLESGNLYDLLDFCTKNLNFHKDPVGCKNTLSEFLPRSLLQYVLQLNTIMQSRRNVAHHYDLNEDFIKLFLDEDFQYSCAYFKNAKDTLEVAQFNKKHHIAKKLLLKPGQRVLDIGSGWGGMGLYLALEYGVEVVGLTLSHEQLELANRRSRDLGLQDQVKFYLRDYREEKGQYDRIVSVGMFEHVGVPQYQTFFNTASNLLKEDGIMLLHSIGCASVPRTTNAWIRKYIFPRGYCPSLSEVLPKIEKTNLLITDIEILHRHYAETLRNWRERFMSHRDQAEAFYNDTFCRMWEFYLTSCELGFRNQELMVFQIQMAKDKELIPMTRDYLYSDILAKREYLYENKNDNVASCLHNSPK